jgi:hypothetical protein
MATRYKVGGAGSWSSTSMWSTTSGGASGASVPGVLDDVIFDANSGTGITFTIDGSPTVLSITYTGTASTANVWSLSGSLTCSVSLSIAGNSATNRLFVRSSSPTTARTITAASVTCSNVDFQDITGAGVGSWNLASATNVGDCGGNSGITCTTAATQYSVGGTVTWSAAASWASTSGGTGGTGRVPLPQDTARLDANSTDSTISVSGPIRFGHLDTTGWTGTLTMASVAWFGSWTFGSGTTMAGTGQNTLGGRASGLTITTAGITITCAINFDHRTGTYQLQDNLTLNRSASGVWNQSSGTIDMNGKTVTCSGAAATATTSGGTLQANGGTFSFGTTSAVTFWACTGGPTITGSPNIALTAASANTRTFGGNGKTYGVLTYTVAASTGILAITGANTFGGISVSGGTRTLRFPSGATNAVPSATFLVFGTAGNLITIDSSTAASAATINFTGGRKVNKVDFVSIKDSTATPSSTAYAGSGSTNVSGNTGWTFTAAPQAKARSGGSFTLKPLLYRSGGAFTEKQLKIRQSGSFVNV